MSAGRGHDLGSLLQRLDAHAQTLVLDLLERTDVGALRATCRSTRAYVDATVTCLELTELCSFMTESPWERCWEVATQLLDGVLSVLRTRWPRCTALYIPASDTEPNRLGFVQDPALSNAGVQGMLTYALLRNPHAARCLQEVTIHWGSDSHYSLCLGAAVVSVLVSECPNLTTLALHGSAEFVEDYRVLQESSFRLLARLPHLSDLTLPAPVCARHVGLLASQLTSLAILGPINYSWKKEHLDREEGGQERTMRTLLRNRSGLESLRSWPRLKYLDLNIAEFGTWDPVETDMWLFTNLPPTLKELSLCRNSRWEERYILEGGRPEEVCVWTTWSDNPTAFVREPISNDSLELSCSGLAHIRRLLEAAGALRKGHKLRSLQVDQLRVQAEGVQGARQLLQACARVHIGALVLCVREGAEAAAAALALRSELGPAVDVVLMLPYPFRDERGRTYLPLQLPRCSPTASPTPAGPSAAADTAPPEPALTLDDFLRSVLAPRGTPARHLLLLSLWLTRAQDELDAGMLEGWLQQHVDPTAAVVRHQVVARGTPLLALELEAGEAAAAAAGGGEEGQGPDGPAAAVAAALAAAGARMWSYPVVALPVKEYPSRDNLVRCFAEALRQWLVGGRGVTPDKLAAAGVQWDDLADAVGYDVPVPHEDVLAPGQVQQAMMGPIEEHRWLAEQWQDVAAAMGIGEVRDMGPDLGPVP